MPPTSRTVLAVTVDGLMDEAVSPEIQAHIQAAITEHGGGTLQTHDLRIRHAGRSTFIDFHLVVPSEMRVAKAHDIRDRIRPDYAANSRGR